MNDLISTASVIRRIIELLPKDNSLKFQLAEFSNKLNNLVNTQKEEIINSHNSYITLGIAFSIQTVLLHNSQVFLQKSQYTKMALQQLLKGVLEYDNRYWKGECAFWSIFVLEKNEVVVNDLICDALTFQKKEVSNENIYIFKSYLLQYLFTLTIKIDSEAQTYEPLYNEANGLNPEMIEEMYIKGIEPGFEILKKDGPLGNEIMLEYGENAVLSLIKIL